VSQGARVEKIGDGGFFIYKDLLGIPYTREAGPANIGPIGKQWYQILRMRELLQHRRPADSGFERSGSLKNR
jgi:hypothetical protein